MLLQQLLLLSLTLSPFAIADVEFTKPAAGASIKGGGLLDVEWRDSGDAPSISDLKSYQLRICSGADEHPVELGMLVPSGQYATGNKASGKVDPNIGASDPENAYFLKMVSVSTTGESIINYSERFSLTDMTGAFSEAVLQGLSTVQGTDGPDPRNKNNLAKRQQEGDFDIPYTLQTGPTRYAPMQPPAPTKIVGKKASPLWPKSDVIIATTWLPTPFEVTTVTQSMTYDVTSRENDVTPAPHPDEMAKFLARWKD